MEQVKSEKVFFNVFPTLKVGDELQMLFSDVEVKKITTNSGRDFLHIHILCRHLIQKKQIWLMEQRIKEQLFGRAAVKIEIVEEFQLSELYTPQAILTEYRESLIEELRQTSVLAANMFARADLRFEEGNLIHLELLDTIVSEGRKEEIVTLVERVLRERFRIDAKLLVAYKETDQEGTREYDEQRIQQEINATFLMYNVSEIIINNIEMKQNCRYRYKANFANAVTNIRLYLRDLLEEDVLVSRIKKFLVPERPERSYKRSIKPKSVKPFNNRTS